MRRTCLILLVVLIVGCGAEPTPTMIPSDTPDPVAIVVASIKETIGKSRRNPRADSHAHRYPDSDGDRDAHGYTNAYPAGRFNWRVKSWTRAAASRWREPW